MALPVCHNSSRRRLTVLLTLLLAVQGYCTQAQTIIRLAFDRSKAGNEPLTLVRPSDSQYVRMTHREDMGAKYGFSYELRETIPDGRYEIYRNDTLELKGTISKGKKTGLWTRFYGIDVETTTYKNGRRNGVLKVFAPDKKMKGRAYYKDDQMLLGENFDKSGAVTRRSYWLEGVMVREEEYSRGKRSKAQVTYRTPGTFGEEQGVGKKAGWIIYRFTAGTFEILLQQNKLIAWRVYDNKGILLTEEKGRP
ncbi:toxin-antitoxin system YwqK family antitoxin [Taibaiella koreensis]|uniref:toxin-antitoxin system YwqK family antitoxin n=1 Tax=Taibaiella koreensis TaxID=1268548 RepID=UPI000E59F414|nr:hypothetical protein [Taibaiella koreensis]